MSRSKLAIGTIAFVLLYIILNMNYWRTTPLSWDAANYYLYLPATVIYHDVGKLEFYSPLVKKYSINNNEDKYGLFPQELTGRILNKYAVGTAFFELPLFLAAHAYCKINTFYPPDGFSPPYRLSISLSGLMWLLIGLWYLQRLLLRYVNDIIVVLSLLLVVFATNIYFYTAFSYGMSHTFSFSAGCLLLYATDSFYRTGKGKYIIWIGLLCGLMTITRPVNLLFAIVPVCWPIVNEIGQTDRIQLWRKNSSLLFVSILLVTTFIWVQLAYYKHVTGYCLYYSYQNEGFHFSDPHIIEGLFSYAKGWFVYTPLAFLALLGLMPMVKVYRQLAILILGIVCVDIYIVFSWHDWEYGGGFSARALIELWPLLALPLAVGIGYLKDRKNKLTTRITTVIASICVVLNVFQSYQLADNITVWAHTNKAFYWRAFGNLHVTEEDKKLLEQQ